MKPYNLKDTLEYREAKFLDINLWDEMAMSIANDSLYESLEERLYDILLYKFYSFSIDNIITADLSVKTAATMDLSE